MAGANLEASTIEHFEHDVARVRHSIAQAGALDSTADAGVLGVPVDVLYGFERFSCAANALPHDLASAVLIAGIEDVSLANVV